MRIFNLSSILILLFSGSTAVADVEAWDKRFFGELNLVRVLSKGVGLGVGAVITPKLATSLSANYSVLKSDSDPVLSGYAAEHKALVAGLGADYYLKSVKDGGFYGNLALVYVSLKTEVDPIFSSSSNTLSTSRVGYQAHLGYDIRTNFGNLFSGMRDIPFGLKLGLGYGAGGAYSNNLGGTKNTIEDSLLLDGRFAIYF